MTASSRLHDDAGSMSWLDERTTSAWQISELA